MVPLQATVDPIAIAALVGFILLAAPTLFLLLVGISGAMFDFKPPFLEKDDDQE